MDDKSITTPVLPTNSADNDTMLDALSDFFVSEEVRQEGSISFGGVAKPKGSARDVIELLAFWVANEEYAIPIVDIKEIIKLPLITEVPRTLPVVLGISSLRGTIVPVLDLRRILGLEEQPVSGQTRVLVLRGDDEPVGLLVDRVTSVVRFERDSLEATPRGMRHSTSECLKGVGRIGQRLIIVLDIAAVLNVLEGSA